MIDRQSLLANGYWHLYNVNPPHESVTPANLESMNMNWRKNNVLRKVDSMRSIFTDIFLMNVATSETCRCIEKLQLASYTLFIWSLPNRITFKHVIIIFISSLEKLDLQRNILLFNMLFGFQYLKRWPVWIQESPTMHLLKTWYRFELLIPLNITLRGKRDYFAKFHRGTGCMDSVSEG